MKSRDGANNKRKKILVVDKKDGSKVADEEKMNDKVEEAAQNIINRAKETLNRSKEGSDSKASSHVSQLESKEDSKEDKTSNETAEKKSKNQEKKSKDGIVDEHDTINKIDEENKNPEVFESDPEEIAGAKVKKSQNINEDSKIKNDKKEVEEKPHVSIDEKQNTSHSVKPDPHKAAVKDEFKPAVLLAPVNNSKIIEYRANDSICAEGSFFKQRVIFSCFWHQKYFVLMKDGKLVYHKLDGSRYAKGNWEMKKAESLTRIEKPGSWHPYRLAFNLEGSVRYFGYDTERERDYWFSKFEKFAKK